MKKSTLLVFVSLCFYVVAFAQPGYFGSAQYWQQAVKYNMNIDMDVNTNRFTGKQRLEYSNNSPMVLNKVFYHLYFNAFQPGSNMDIRSQELGKVLVSGRPDWDGRVKDRIANLKPDEIGYQKIISLKMNGITQPFKYHETILEVNLTKPIAAKSKVVFEMEFEAQVPLQIRRSGRDNPTTGVRYSMSQWYPKLCEYDYEGWHPTPYVAREFYGVWGNFDVTINIDKTYKLGGTGVLMNANEIGWGYDKPGTELKSTGKAKRSWHFVGENIHDFVWTADPEYKHLVYKMPNGGPTLHSIYNYKANDAKNDSAWATVLTAAAAALPFIEKNFGKYPYPQYSFIQGGDGGMEYPMATLLVGPGLGTVFHEWLHSWYQMMLGTNESLYAWMDEGFTSYAEDQVTKFYDKKSALQNYRDALQKNPNNKNLKEAVDILPEDHSGAYMGYFNLAKSNFEEPMTTHSDHYNSNYGYSVAAYSKGEVFMEQLGYIVGAEVRNKILLEYYKQWRFKHPNANDLVRVAEDVSGIQLDWYKEYWISTTKTIDYKIDSLWEENGVSKIRLKRIGHMPMPIDLQLTFKDGSTEMFYVPLNLMYGSKPNEKATQKREVLEEWKWTHPTYIVEMKRKLTDLKIVEIDPSKRMADIDRKNNTLELNW
ncbi:MAG: M1 family metallopeptidase [Ferruginibacter sp.]